MPTERIQDCVLQLGRNDAGFQHVSARDPAGSRPASLRRSFAWRVPPLLNERPQSARGMSDVEWGRLSRSPAGRNYNTVSDSHQNVLHGQNESVDAISGQKPGARLARVENCKSITR